MNEFNVSGFDPETQFQLRLKEAERKRAGAQLLVEEGVQQLAEAKKKVSHEVSARAGFQASGSGEWGFAPVVRYESDLLARAWNTRPRAPGNSYFVHEYLCGLRVLQTGASVSAAVEHVPTGVPAPPTASFRSARSCVQTGRWAMSP
jgi:hypothetical protein